MVVGWSGWARSHFFMVCWNRSTLPQVVGWLGREFFWMTPRSPELVLEAVAAAVPPWRQRERVVNTMPLSVSVEAGIPCWAAALRKVGEHDRCR